MYRNVILPMDAIIAVSLVDLSMQDCTLSDTTDALHSTFQNYPDFEYLCMAKKLLNKLNLHEIWHNELLYYGKILQVDHNTLENDIDKGITRLFTKCDDISDDNINLSSSLVTSSYFNKKKDRERNDFNFDKENADNIDIVPDIGERSNITKNLASTLKKHATLNKCERNATVLQNKKRQNKRKRSDITINTSNIRNKMFKKNKKINANNDVGNISDSEEMDERNILNAVPSVNDAFLDLGVDLKIKIYPHNETMIDENDRKNNKEENVCIKEELDETSNLFNNSYAKESVNKDTYENVKEKTSVSSVINTKDISASKTANKLKVFQFEEKHDFDKYDEKPQMPLVNHQIPKTNLEHDNGPKTNTSTSPKSVQSSQLSIFESSDCEIDLDI